MTCLEEFLRGSVISRKSIQQHSLGLQSCIWGKKQKNPQDICPLVLIGRVWFSPEMAPCVMAKYLIPLSSTVVEG